MAKRILVQAGHLAPRDPNHLNATGTPGEIGLVTAIRKALCRLLDDDDRFDAIPKPGLIEPGLDVDAALFLHGDGFEATSSGYSLGFPEFDINRRLAQMIATEFEKIPGHPPRRADNNTVNMREYYGYNRVETPGPEVLVEHGFLTNPAERAWLLDNVDRLARAEYTALCRFFGFPPGGAGVQERSPGGMAVTPDSPLRAAPRAPRVRAVAHLLAREDGNGAYTDGDVRMIVGHYYATAPAVGLDPLVVVAQMVLETGGLTSFWSQRPRRNPAGIGVTGAEGVGLSFPDWKTAVRAHAGRLLAYALPSGQGNAEQRDMIDEALAFRPLPAHLRGAAPTLRGLAGTFAVDPRYAHKISRVANDIRLG